MYPSKYHVSCFYCEWTGRKDKAKEHWRKKHPEEKFKLKIAENSLSKYHFRRETTETTGTNTNDDDTDTDICEEQHQINTITLSPSIPISTASTIDTLISPSMSALGTPSIPSTPSNLSTSSSPSKTFKSPNSIQDQLTSMAKQLSKITVAIEDIHLEKTRKESSSSSVPVDENEQLFESIKCTDDLFMLKSLEINIQLDTITCIPCSTWKKQAPKHLSTSIKSSFGVFQHIAQKIDEPLSQRFRSLKTHLKSHFWNKLHIWCVQEEEERRQAFEDFLRKNEKAGFNVGRAALFAIRSGLGGLKFLDTLNLLDLSGANIGTYRHSRWFFEKLRASMARTMKVRVMEYLKAVDPIIQHHRAFGITFDKVTLMRRSMQVTMLIVLVDGELTPIYLQSPLCRTELSGEELAENCVRVMESFGLSQSMLQQQLTGCAVDGAYIHLNISKHLCHSIGINEEWLSISWDFAHLLELAILDVKKQRQFLWLTRFIKTCGLIMSKYSYGKQYEQLLETAELLGEDVLQPKQFHATRFVSSECRVYETLIRDWPTLYELHEKDSIANALIGGDLSTRTRHNIKVQDEAGVDNIGTLKIEEMKSVDFVCKLLGLTDIYKIIVKTSLFVQNVSKYPWEYDDAICRLQECLNNYTRLLEQLDLNATQEMNSIEECEQDAPVTPQTTTTTTTIDYENYDNTEEDEEQPISSTPSITYMEQNYESLSNGMFKDRPILRRRGDYDLEDPTVPVRQKLIVLCQELVGAIETRFKDTPRVFLLMKSCLDVSSLYEQVVLTSQQVLADYGQSALQELIDFTMKNSKYIKIDSAVIQQQYMEWKQRCLLEIADKDTFDIWTTNGKIISPKVMKTFFTNKELADGIHEFLYFYSLMILKIRSEAVCESASSILKAHIHNNRSLQHSSLDDEVMIHWNAPPLHMADLFLRSSLNNYFSHTKDKHWLFFKKSEQYQVWKLVSPGSVVLNRLRKVQVARLPEPHDIQY